jgi:hypothetical protein
MLADPRGARHWRRRRLESLRLRYLDYQAPPPRPTNADLPVAARAPGARGAICADRHWNRICGVSSAAREQLVEERAMAAEKREVPKRLRCHRFEVGPTVRIRFAPAASPVRTALLRHFEENAELGFLVIRFSMPRRCVRLTSNQIRRASRHWDSTSSAHGWPGTSH